MDELHSITKQIMELKIGNGIQYLLDEFSKIIEHPVMVHDMEYKVIAHTKNVVSDDPIWNEFVKTGTVGLDRLEFYKNEDFFDTAANASKITFLTSKTLKKNRIYGKLFSGEGIQVGCACIMEGDEPFTGNAFNLFECFCDVLNKELEGDEFFRDYGQQYQQTLINRLINGKIDDKRLYTAHVESIYINLLDNIYLAVADVSRCGITSGASIEKLVFYRDKFKKILPCYKYSIYENFIAVIISSEYNSLDEETDLKKISRLLDADSAPIYIGISGCFDNLFELGKYYKEAVSALGLGAESNDKGGIFVYNR